MSPERQAIIDAINEGHCTPKEIGVCVGKLPQTISKLLYLMAKQGVVQKSGYGNYRVVEGSIKSTASIESSIAQALLFKVEAIENRLSNLEGGQVENVEPSIDSSIDSTLEKLQSENEALQAKNADLEFKLEENRKLIKRQSNNLIDLNCNCKNYQVGEAQAKANAKDLESKLEKVQGEAQAGIDLLTQKLNEASNEIQRQSTEYNQLHKKYMTLKTDIFDGKVPVKSTSRKSLTLDGEAKVKYIIDTDKAKARVAVLTKEGLDHKEITLQLESEGYRTKGLLGDIKPYLSTNIGKWQKKFNQKGHI